MKQERKKSAKKMPAKNYKFVDKKTYFRTMKDFYDLEIQEVDKNSTFEEVEPKIKDACDKIFGPELLESRQLSKK